ncbi:MAG: hypothetical protein HY367_01335 [Candidatus Aenigmarchaeota archaeon]|nr:hypothetical protein [Candidatus Aenigmarchaeota archaeon]
MAHEENMPTLELVEYNALYRFAIDKALGEGYTREQLIPIIRRGLITGAVHWGTQESPTRRHAIASSIFAVVYGNTLKTLESKGFDAYYSLLL